MIHYNYLIYENNQPVYVGARTTKFEDSLLDIKYLGSGKLIIQAIKEKSIENFTKEILAECKTRFEVEKNEETFIKYFKTHISQDGYNISWFGGNRNGGLHSEESKQKIGKAQIGNTNVRGKITIHKENEETRVKKEELQQYLDDGWEQGFSKEHIENITGRKCIYNKELDIQTAIKKEEMPYYLNNGYELGTRPFSDEARKNISKGRIGINFSEEHEQHLSEALKGMIRIYNKELDIETAVKEEDLQYYLNNGYKLGKRPFSEEHIQNMKQGKTGNHIKEMKWVYNEELNEEERIKKEEIPQYLKDGWELKRKSKLKNKN